MQDKRQSEYDFALVASSMIELTPEVMDAIFEAGCDDATLSTRCGRLYLMFSRTAPSLKDAILSAIRDVEKTNVGVEVLRVDSCDLVTPADIARRMGRSRQMVHQFISGTRGPGTFPPPICHLAEKHPLWGWCEVAAWLAENDFIKEDVLQFARDEALINNVLELRHQQALRPERAQEIIEALSRPAIGTP